MASAETCPCMPSAAGNSTAVVEAPEDVTFNHFVVRNWWLMVLLFAEILVVIVFYVYHCLWNRRQKNRDLKAGVMKDTEAYSLELVRYFLPSIQVEKYRFRGLRKKEQTLSIAFEDLGLELHNGACVLEGVTGDFKAGRLCAVMGPSGAGKTTFMNVLCGKAHYGTMTGSVFVNGEEKDISEYKPVMGFVPQEDIVHENLTVGEQIEFSAQLRSPRGTPQRTTQLITEDVLNVMQIDHIRNSIVGGVEHRGISGGQRKRVNIGLELASDPSVLFLDEPTSGLDSTSSLTIVHSLKKMTQLGMTSIMVIHQPRYSLFTLFDTVLLLGKGGRTVYLGSSMGAMPYFEGQGFEMPPNENPADWLMDVISGEVKNTKVAQFQPPMLFDMWEQNKAAVRAQPDHVRGWTESDDRKALTSKLEEEWKKIDKDHNGVMDMEELQVLLTTCTGKQKLPDAAVVRELFRRMASSGSEVVSKQEFIDFLVGLQGVVAHDHALKSDDPHDTQNPFHHHHHHRQFAVHNPFLSVRPTTTGERALMLNSREQKDQESGTESEDESAVLDRTESRPCYSQLPILLHRQSVIWWRNNRMRAVFLGVVMFASIILAVMDRFVCQEPQWSATPYLNLHTALALLTSVFSLGLFGADRPVFWRESSSGLSVFAFFVARVVVNASDLMLQCFMFSALYYCIRRPDLNFGEFFVPHLLVTFSSSGVGYFISSILNPTHGPFVAALVSFVSCGLLGHPLRVGKLTDHGVMEIGMDLISITRWSVAMSFMRLYEEKPPTNLNFQDNLELMAMLKIYRDDPMWQEKFGVWYTGMFFLLCMGLVLHILAFLGLRFTHRDKQV